MSSWRALKCSSDFKHFVTCSIARKLADNLVGRSDGINESEDPSKQQNLFVQRLDKGPLLADVACLISHKGDEDKGRMIQIICHKVGGCFI